MKYFVLIIALFAISSIDAKQKYYKWVDADGNTHYSARKPHNQATSELKVSTNQPEIINKESQPEPKSTENTEELTDEQKRTNEYNKNEKERVEKAQNKANCKIAKKNLATLQAEQRVKRKNPATGEYIYIDDSARIEMMKTVKKSIRKLCK